MKLHEKIPECVVFFLAGSLPAQAILHLRQLSLFMMICHLDGNPLKSLALNTLIEARPSAKSWFHQIRDLCIQYELPHPISLLHSKPPREMFKKLCKAKVHEYWHWKLSEAASLPSLEFLQPDFLSLSSPHPIWSSLVNVNSYQTKAAKIQALFISGRYRTERMCRFWSNNPDGFCLMDSCRGKNIYDDIYHIIVHCDSLSESRRRLRAFTKTYIEDKPEIAQIVNQYLNTKDEKVFMQFTIDCSVLAPVITAYQQFGQSIHEHLFRITRTWCRTLHRDRLRMLGRFSRF